MRSHPRVHALRIFRHRPVVACFSGSCPPGAPGRIPVPEDAMPRVFAKPSCFIMPMSHPHRGFTLPELLVVLLITALAASLVRPVARRLADRGHAVRCAANLRQIGVAVMGYAADNHMRLPATTHQRRQGGKSWTITLQPYAAGTLAFKCPEDPDQRRPYSYLLNDFLTPNPAGAPDLDFSRLSSIPRPEATLMFGEASPSYRGTDHFHFSPYRNGVMPAAAFESQVAAQAHATGANYLFVDGHVETLSRNEALERLSAPAAAFIHPSVKTTP
jgi:prepilin-type N-terminal cleavage/methylation domain-containing protein/prepilin-type processing-associated H-X9-DG protein